MLTMNRVWTMRGAWLGMLATVVILAGCASASRPPAAPAVMTPIEPTATMIVPTATVSAEATPADAVATEIVPTEIVPTQTAISETDAATPDVTGPTPSPELAVGEYEVVETSTQYVQAQVDVPVLNAPVVGAEEIGLIFDGQTALVTGASPDGAWLRIICSDDSVGDCWVAADPAMVRPTAPQ